MKKVFSVSAIFALSVLLVACFSTSEEMEDSVWVDDSEISGLPAYSECGYNTFGARYFGSSFFFSRKFDKPGSFIWKDGMLSFTLSGYLEDRDVIFDQRDYYGGYNRTMTFTAEFPYDTIRSFEELVRLENTTIDLSDTTNKVYVYVMNVYERARIYPTSGTINFKRVQRLFLDDELNEAIVSGTFDVLSEYGGRILTLTDGRFDVGVSDACFLFMK